MDVVGAPSQLEITSAVVTEAGWAVVTLTFGDPFVPRGVPVGAGVGALAAPFAFCG